MIAALGLSFAGCSGLEPGSTAKATTPLAEAPAISEPFPLDHLQLVPGLVYPNSAAAGPPGYLITSVVFEELEATRVAPDGTALDLAGLALDPIDDYSKSVSLYAGDHWIVVWGGTDALRCARISDAGDLLDPGGVAIGPGAVRPSSLAYDGTHVLIGVSKYVVDPPQAADDPSLFFTTPSCAVASGPVRPVGGIGVPRVSYNGQSFLVLYTAYEVPAMGDFRNTLYVQALDTNGQLLGLPVQLAQSLGGYSSTFPPKLLPPPAITGDIDAGANDSLVAYFVADGASKVTYRTLSQALVLGPEQTLSDAVGAPSVGALTDGFGIAVPVSAETTRIATVLGTAPAQGSMAGYFRETYLLPMGTGLLAVTDRAVPLGADLAPIGDPLVLRLVPTPQAGTTTAASRNVYLNAWFEYDPTAIAYSNSVSLRAARLSPAGALLDSTAITLVPPSPDGSSPPVGENTLESNGEDFLVAWLRGSYWGRDGLRATRVLSDGTVADTTPLVLEASCSSSAESSCAGPSMASDGHDYLVVWSYAPDSVTSELHAARVTASGTVLDSPPLVVSDIVIDPYSARVAFDGTRYLIAASSADSAYLFRVGTDGTLGPTTTTSGSYGFLMNFTWGAGQGLAVFGTDVGNGNYAITGVRIGSDGALLDQAGDIVVAPFLNSYPSVAWDGNDYVLAWITNVYEGNDLIDDLRVARVSPDGVVKDPGGVALPFVAGPPGVASSGQGQTLIATYDATSVYGVPVNSPRAFGFFVGKGADAGSAGGEAGATARGGTGAGGGSGEPRGGEAGEPTGAAATSGTTARGGSAGNGAEGGATSDGQGHAGDQAGGAAGEPEDTGGSAGGGARGGASAKGGSSGAAGSAGGGAQPPAEPPPDSGCGCSVPRRDGSTLPLGTLLVTAAAAFRRGRRRSRGPRKQRANVGQA